MKTKSLPTLLLLAALGLNLSSFGQWVAQGGAGFTGTDVAYTSIGIAKNDTPVIAFRDNGFAGGKATVMHYANNSWTSLGGAGFTAGAVKGVSLAVDSATQSVYVAYLDTLAGLSVSKFNGTSWGFIGATGIATGTPDQIQLMIAGNGTPYLGYRDANGTNKTNLKKFSGGSWSTVGAANFSAAAEGVAFAIDHSGVPYCAASLAGGAGLIVQKFDGSNWVTVGNAGFDTALSLSKISIAIANNNQPYIALTKNNSANSIAAWAFNGTAWIGNTVVSATRGQGVSLVVSKQGVPFASYNDYGASNKATVAYYSGGSWHVLGNADFSGSTAKSLSLAVNSLGYALVGYQDVASGSAATVEKYLYLAGINETSGLADFRLYPNPNTGRFRITYKGTQTGEVQLTVTNMMGQTIWTEMRSAGNDVEEINLAGVEKGLYTLQVKTADGIANTLVEIE